MIMLNSTWGVLFAIALIAVSQVGWIVGFSQGRKELAAALHKEKTDHLALRSLMIGLQSTMKEDISNPHEEEWLRFITSALEADYSDRTHHHIHPADRGGKTV